MSTSFRLLVPRPIYDDLLVQAHAELPNECCGILAGKIVAEGDQRLGRVERRYPLVNSLASPKEYHAESKGLFQAHHDMRNHKIDVLAIYHSHPTTHPVPSRKDRERLFSDDVICLIISLQAGAPEARAWWLTPDCHREAEWEVVDGDADLPAGPP